MSHTNDVSATLANISVVTKTPRHDAVATTKDAGRVKMGGACINFGGNAAATRDKGRVKMGGACIHFT